MFRPVSPQIAFPDLDREALEHWEQLGVFQMSLEQSKGKPPFVFFEGPPTANGMPHPGHVLTRVMKDVFLRYKTMCGFHVPRRAGWDTHGLPVEVEVEKELGIHGREAIEAYGVEAFTRRCVDSVFRYIDEWRRMTSRLGFWIDLDDAYVTFKKSYVESVWWALKTLFDDGLLYQGYKVVWWWPKGGTALSAGEVGQGYKSVDDPSVFVRFAVHGQDKTSFLAWTTTPWTLPSNIALAVHPEQTYATVELEDGERVVLASALIAKLIGEREHTIVEERTGEELVGIEYEPPFRYSEPEGGPAFRVVAADFVTIDTGSGMVHMAPAFGEDDFRVCQQQGLGFLQLVKPDGTFKDEATDFAGRFCKEADRDILRQLRDRGLLFAEQTYRHDYPYCWRAMDDPLIQYARNSWFIRTTKHIDRVIDNNAQVNWEPQHIRDGRFGAFLRTNVDWALSRERYWGTPLPIWVNDETGQIEAVASVDEILKRNPDGFAAFRDAQAQEPELSDDLMVHKPWIDAVTWEKPGEPGVYRRVPEVIDCWFDSGCMPFAQWGYPHQNRERFEQEFPADFITEAVDQTRGWFYSLMTISTLLFKDRSLPHPFRNCVVLGLISDDKGQKLSKSKKNYTDPMEMIAKHGADATRWALYTGTVPGQGTRLHKGSAPEAVREFLLKFWNVYSFFVTYANIDEWKPSSEHPPLSARRDMDRWILAELDATVTEVRHAMDAFRSHVAARRLALFADALSNWYVRRSRSRFWAEGDSEDKAAAFATLYEVLVEFAHLLAPFTPFMVEAVFKNLVPEAQRAVPSIHLAPYPEPQPEREDRPLRRDMDAARTVVSLGQRVRAERKLKVRQPLSRAIAVVASAAERSSIERFAGAIREELNVHQLEFTEEPGDYVEFHLVPNFRSLGPKLGKQMPACKKALSEADGSALHDELQASGTITVKLPDGTVTLDRDDVEIRLVARDDFAAASSHGHVVVLDTRVDDTLRHEGWAREVINRIQRTRKELDLSYEARIVVQADAAGELRAAIETHASRIKSETLTSDLTWNDLAQADTKGVVRTEIDGQGFAFVVAHSA